MNQDYIDSLKKNKETLRLHEEYCSRMKAILNGVVHEITLMCDHVRPNGESAFNHWSCEICGKESPNVPD